MIEILEKSGNFMRQKKWEPCWEGGIPFPGLDRRVLLPTRYLTVRRDGGTPSRRMGYPPPIKKDGHTPFWLERMGVPPPPSRRMGIPPVRT